MLHIVGMGAAHPTTIIDNHFIESLNVGTNQTWILEKIGIERRVTTLPLEYIRTTRNHDQRQAREVASHAAWQLGAEAARVACERAGISTSKIGLVLCNCCTPRTTFPTEGQRIAAALGVTAPCYDLTSACPAFALHVNYLQHFEETALPEYTLCVSTATMTHKVNYNDRTDGAIWGDGAAAWIVSPTRVGKLRIVDSTFHADPCRCETVVVGAFDFFHQDGRAVRDFSVRQTVRMIKALEEQHGIDWNKDIFVGHQANATMLAQITNNREIPAANHWHNVTAVGNQAGAGAPAVLAEHWNDIKPGMRIMTAVVGAGLSWGSVLMQGD